MDRTRNRPLPAGDVDPRHALVFGLTLEAVAFAVLWATAGLLPATLAVSAMLFYVFVYTIWLKPRSVHNIVIGGAAGAVPVLVGWSAVTGTLSTPAWVLFAIVFAWTPPHFWALALRYRDDYAAAGIPMLPVVKGVHVAAREILGYSVAVVAVSLTLPFVSVTALIYVTAAIGLGAGLVWRAAGLLRDPSPESAMKFFTFANLYLALLFAAVALDILVQSA
jgi:protoheme IX farnesyltransferase